MKQIMSIQTLPKKKKRSRTGTYMKAAVLIAVAFVFIAISWYYMPVMGSNESKYCVRCHSMIPEYTTWQASYHAQFQCKECHRESGVTQFIKYQGRIFTEIFFYRTGGGAIKTPMKDPMPNAVCLKCHSENRNYTPSSDTVVPHDKHLAKGVACVSCHAGVAHGRIVQRGITKQIPPEEWNKSLAQEQMDFNYTTPRMAVCLDCHGKRQVSEKCSVCHNKQIVPANHKSEGWERLHGQSAQQDFKPCNLCHVYSMKKQVDLTQITVPEYIKNNTFCFNCHLQKPSTHKDPRFREVHGELAKSRGLGNCTGCHDINQQKQSKDSGPKNKVYCNQCHWFK